MRKGGAARAVLVVVCAALIVSGCQQGGGLSPSGSATPSGSASASATSSARPPAPRPIAADFAVERTRDPAEEVTGTIPLIGVVTGVEVDPIVGRAYVTLEGALVALDVAGREIVDRIGLPGNYPRVAADPWAGVLYATRGGRIGELISVIDATTLETTRTLEVDGATLWGIAVDPTTGLLWVMEEGATEEDSARVAVVDPAAEQVLARIPVEAEAGASLAVDPVRGLVLLVENAGYGRMLVLDAARRELLRTIEVLPGTHEPCPNCMFYLSTPVVDATTGLVYVAGRPPGLSEHPGASQDPDVPIGALGPAKAGVVPVGLAQGGRTPGGVPAGGDAGGTVYVVDPEAGEVLDTIDVPGSVVRSWAGDPAAGVVYLTVEMGPAPGVRALDTESLELGDPIPIEGQTPLAVDPNTGTVWVAGGGAVTIVE